MKAIAETTGLEGTPSGAAPAWDTGRMAVWDLCHSE